MSSVQGRVEAVNHKISFLGSVDFFLFFSSVFLPLLQLLEPVLPTLDRGSSGGGSSSSC